MCTYGVELLISLSTNCLWVEEMPFDPKTICVMVSLFVSSGEKTYMHINSAHWATEILRGERDGKLKRFHYTACDFAPLEFIGQPKHAKFIFLALLGYLID